MSFPLLSGWTATQKRGSSQRNAPHSRSIRLEILEERCLLSADPVLEWNGIALDALKNDSYLGANAKQAGPDRAARALAIVQAAVFDSVNSIDRSYDPYMIQIVAPKDSSITAATAQAAHDTLVSLFPDYKSVLDTRLSADLATVSSVRARDHGALVGQIVAAGILAARSNDGADVPMNYTFGSGPGAWQVDPLHPTQTAVGSLWGNVTTFALPSAESFHVPPPPALTSQQYTTAYNEVKDYGGDGIISPTLRTAEQTQIGIFWGYDGSRGLSTPPRLYNQVAETIAVQQHNTVVQNARFFALIDIGLGDASIACWDAKFDYNFWRPVTAIRAAGTDGNPNTVADTTWTPLGAPADNGGGTNFTPPFPAYASGHATFGGTLFRLMADFYGRDDIHFTLHSDEFNGITTDQNGVVRPVVTRSYTSFSQAAEENGQSRIYLGIHWSFDKVQAIAQGTDIADYMFRHLLTARHDDDGHHEGGHHDPRPKDGPHDRGDDSGRISVELFRALTTLSGAVVLGTTDGRPFDSGLSTHTPSDTIATTASSINDLAMLTKNLIEYLDRVPWGGANRGGHTLEIDLDAWSGDVFEVR